jgi:hypothetical protein
VTLRFVHSLRYAFFGAKIGVFSPLPGLSCGWGLHPRLAEGPVVILRQLLSQERMSWTHKRLGNRLVILL